MRLELSKAVMINGAPTRVIEYDLDILTADDVDRATMDLKKQSYVVTVAELDTKLNAALFAYAAELTPLDLKVLPAKDYMKVAGLVRDFLYNDSAEPSTPEPSVS